MKTNIGITEENRAKVAEHLSKILADEFLIYTKTLRAHWNLEGIDFHTKHVFFEDHYNAIKEFVDSVAERIRKIGHYAPATLKQFLQLTHLSEEIEGDNSSLNYMKVLLQDHDTIIIEIRKIIPEIEEELNDVGTADFLTGLLQEHEEMAWMLRASVS
ncbi:DNA starvation/stationary phase protection protein [Cellulophaga sp. E16_2]|uniref:Ferritin Dps family protein n=1 Tax=Cellulophaga algicola (strain DSM 14237 / IC166 / ACAM 630) TaxID=688270 RepID=E6XD27_CELAD|nr:MULTISPECIES: DNA starvation/stationary phase protection protein [Cellulophaga]ADV51214.1 Ferritin Dps family protein [Cellulophaga algicola DSM 14237]MBO0593601.1 DNA starvation/stationary phase protection protein [Cellulophaga sp. E16_2]